MFLNVELLKGGKHKILDQCTLPITGKGVVSRIITDMVSFRMMKSLVASFSLQTLFGFSINSLCKWNDHICDRILGCI